MRNSLIFRHIGLGIYCVCFSYPDKATTESNNSEKKLNPKVATIITLLLYLTLWYFHLGDMSYLTWA